MTLLAHIHAMLIYIREGILQYSGGNERAAMHDGVGIIPYTKYYLVEDNTAYVHGYHNILKKTYVTYLYDLLPQAPGISKHFSGPPNPYSILSLRHF